MNDTTHVVRAPQLEGIRLFVVLEHANDAESMQRVLAREDIELLTKDCLIA